MSIFVSTTPFGLANSEPLNLLNESGFIYRLNKKGRKLAAKDLAEVAKDVSVIIAGTEDLGPLIEKNHSLRMIARVGIGLDGVPLEECKRLGIRVSWTPDAVTKAVAELTIGMMIMATRFIGKLDRDIRKRAWNRPAGRRIQESVIGIIGFGRIGSSVAGLLTSFYPKEVLVVDIKEKSSEIQRLRMEGLQIRSASLGELLSHANILSLHVPLSKQTRHMIGRKELLRMTSDAVLINTARGGIVDEEALFQVLNSGHLGGAAIDVFEEEPYFGQLCKLSNVVLTPHLGSCAIDSRARMELEATSEALRFLRGQSLIQEVPEEEYKNQN